MQRKKILITTLIALLVIGVGAMAYAQTRKHTTTPIVNQPSNRPADSATQSEALKKESKQAASAVKNPSTSSPPTDSDAKVEVTEIKQENNQIVIVAKLTMVPSGTCTLRATQSGTTITETVQVIYQPDYSSCAGFAIPVSKFANKGQWTFDLHVQLQDNRDVSTSKVFTIE